jgi:chromosome segregation ATPase
MKTSDVIISVAQVAMGGTIVQGFVALIRRRSELRQLDRNTDSVVVETAEHLVGVLRSELDQALAENRQLKADLADMQRQVQALGARISKLGADLVVAQAEIARLRDHQS